VILKVYTYTGSVYRIDYDARTWERTQETSVSGAVRTGGRGTWTQIKLPGEGLPMIIYGPPVDPEMDIRQITTSMVTKIEEL